MCQPVGAAPIEGDAVGQVQRGGWRSIVCSSKSEYVDDLEVLAEAERAHESKPRNLRKMLWARDEEASIQCWTDGLRNSKVGGDVFVVHGLEIQVAGRA